MKRENRITVLVAVGMFLALSVMTRILFAVTKKDEAPAAAAPAPVATAASAQAESFPRISINEVKTLADSGAVTIIDVRDSDSYLASHVAGALHIPLSRIEGEIPYLPKGKKIVTYCTCPAEETSGEAVLILQKSGLDAAALLGGFNAWTNRGFPTAAGVK
jgi:rhodanese-related sulfurtransferase